MHLQGTKRYRDAGEGLLMVLLFGENFQLMHVSDNGAIDGYAERCVGAEQHVNLKRQMHSYARIVVTNCLRR